MKEIIYEFAAVACVSGIICYFSSSFKGGLGKTVSLVCTLCLMCSILMPLLNFLKNADNVGGLPEMDITDEYDDSQEYYKTLKELTEKKLAERETMELCSEFGLSEEDFVLCFSGNVSDGIYSLDEVTFEISTFRALSRRDDILEYLEKKYNCRGSATEKLIDGE